MKPDLPPRFAPPNFRSCKTILLGVLSVVGTLILFALSNAHADQNPPDAPEIDLLQQYPTKLTIGDTNPDNARPWQFDTSDIYRVTRFNLEISKDLRLDVGPADVGIGHCPDGAVWAVLIPRANGSLRSPATNRDEAISHVWLRFHPKEINRLFPPNTVFKDGSTNLAAQMRFIANFKKYSSWHAGEKFLIPEPKDFTVDVDTENGSRRFLSVDTDANAAQYWPAFANRSVRRPASLTPKLAADAFDQIWDAFERKYAMFTLRPEVDWTKLREQYRPKALASQSAFQFADVCAEMLRNLRDLHVSLTLEGADVPVFDRPLASNANPGAYRAILGEMKEEGHVAWAVTTNNIGYITIYGWDQDDIPAQCSEALEQMRNTRGLIIDVRLNGGGSEPLAAEFASRFVDKEFVYANSQYRKGPSHTDLTEQFPRKITPGGPWRYDRPVLLLIGQKCMSSDESFVGMMSGNPQVTTMGDHTCGSSGNPERVDLPLNMTVSVPQWIDYRPDGVPLDERGFQPQILFKPSPGAFEGNRDDLLTAALDRLRQAPLPDKPIAGPKFLSDKEAESQDKSRPRVIAVFPEDGAQSVETITELRVRFDRPMDPLSLKLDWKSGGFLDCEFPLYNTDNHEFTIAVHLPPGTIHQVVVNDANGNLHEARVFSPRDGFQSSDNRLARLFAWKFKTKDPAPVQKEATPPKILKISPLPGGQTTYRTFLEIQFDQPMESPAEALPYLIKPSGLKEAILVSHVDYDATHHTFRLPLLLPPKEQVSFFVAGFHGTNGAPSEPVKLEYRVSGEALANGEQEELEAGEKNPRLLDTMTSMQRNREKITSLAEKVQTFTLSQQKGLYKSLKAQKASFKWQKPDRFYADATDMIGMCSAFVIGADGQNWWWHIATSRSTNLVVCPANEIGRLSISLCDPFDLTHKTPVQAAGELGLTYLGLSKFGSAQCQLLEGWQIENIPEMTPVGSLDQWLIDTETGRPLEVKQFGEDYLMRARFLYEMVNQPLAPEDFAVPKIEGLSPVPPESLDADYTNRFINLRDGSDGTVSVRWGKEGPKGRSSGGLN